METSLVCVLIQMSLTLDSVLGGSLLVDTTHGTVQGTTAGESDVFLGVPYAEPPVGKLRWKSPQPKEAWAPEVLQATAVQPGCPQICKDVSFACPPTTSEDCLYLNIYRPSNPRSPGLLPVLIFIHGGNFQDLSCSSVLYTGQVIAPTLDTVFVCMDYRLGALGFLYLEGDSATSEKISGNFGLEDQVAALKFLHQNLESFGGDPRRVTLIGQSSGAEAVAIIMMDQELSDLFQQAILLSDPFSLPLKTPTDSNVLGLHFAKLAGCPDGNITCLRGKSAEQITEASHASMNFLVNPQKAFQLFQQWGPTVEQQTIKEFESLEKLDLKPMIIGTVSEEGRLFVYEMFNDPVSSTSNYLYLSMLIADGTDKLFSLFPANTRSDDQRDVLADLVTEYLFACPTQHVTELLVAKGESAVYHYLFDYVLSFNFWERFTWCKGHTCHGGDGLFIYLNSELGGFEFTEEENVFRRKYETYFKNFIHNGDPNKGLGDSDPDLDLTIWPKAGAVPDYISTLQFQIGGIKALAREESDACHYFDKMGYTDLPNVN